MSALRLRRRTRGQALIEFALTLIPFLFLMMGVVDLGRGIAINNGVAQAAREIARTTSVHPGSPLGTSGETAEAIAVQKALVLNMADPSTTIAISCTNISGTAVPNGDCTGGKEDRFVRVDIRVHFFVLTPVLSMINPMTLQSTSHVEIP